MRLVQFLKRVWRAIKAVVRYLNSLYSVPWALLTALVRPVGDAVVRLARWFLKLLWTIVEWIAERWSHVFQPSNGPGREHTPTPGATGTVLLAAVMAALIWLPLVLNGALRGWEIFGQWATFGIGLAYLRYRARSLLPGPLDTAIVAVAERFGLIWIERTGVLVALWAMWATWPAGALTSISLNVAIGFLAVLATPYAPRVLPGELPKLLSPPVHDDHLPEDAETLRFRWHLQGFPSSPAVTTDVAVVLDRYHQQKATNPKRPVDWPFPDFTRWVVDGTCPEVHQVAADIRSKSAEHGLGVLGEITAVLAFVQAIPYSFDIDSTGEVEYWRFPLETLVDRTGDCEDTAILAMAVLRVLGHRVVPLATTGHAAFGVEVDAPVDGHCVVLNGRKYFYCETTEEGFVVGELPAEIDATELVVCPLRSGSELLA